MKNGNTLAEIHAFRGPRYRARFAKIEAFSK